MGWVWPLGELWKDKIADNMKTITSFLAPIIDRALEQEDKSKEPSQTSYRTLEPSAPAPEKVEEGVTLLSHLVKTSKNRKMLLDETLNLLVAGRDTVRS
jgi:hypothetical protein